ncbi:DUF1345 domain-containing protein [Microbacterium sp. NPDC055910]|uniref:DUF1345 domain-containing protein n=1 Tax=Microbacterium sp. NPDC055910 TaxID=3345659 RepID=UPI0035DD5FCE
MSKGVRVVGGVIVRVVDLIVQLALIAIGVLLIDPSDDGLTVVLLLLWCLLGTAYWAASAIAVGISVRLRPAASDRFRRLELHPVVAAISTTATFLTSVVGLVAVATILLLRNDPEWAGWVEPVAVWAMLVSWALFHWGFARIYDRRYRRAADPPLVFPGTPSPRLVDFVYFSFTNATAFSVSDVQVTSSRMRWTVVWHTTLSFFLNALIIVLAFSTIINA